MAVILTGLDEAARLIDEETPFDPGDPRVDRRTAARMLVSITYADWCREKTYSTDVLGHARTSEGRAYDSLLSWGVDLTNVYRVLAIFETVKQGLVPA